jgi:pilus assembly protein CpaB
MKQKIVLIISIVIGVLAFLLTRQYLQGEKAKIEKMLEDFRKRTKMVWVVAAKNSIPGQTTISRKDLNLIEVAENTLTDRAIMNNEVERIIGKKTVFDVKQGKMVLWSDIEGGLPSDQGLAPIIKERMRAISLNISGAAGVSGMIQPNDRVDVLGTFNFPSKRVQGEMETVTLTMLQDVTVLATGQTLAKQIAYMDSRKKSAGGYSTVTLEVTPKEGELLVFAQQMRGSLTIALRNPNDQSFEKDLPEVNFENLEKKLPELNKWRQEKIRFRRTD